MVLLASDFDKSKYQRAEGQKQATKFRIKAATAESFENKGKTEMKLVLWFTTSEQGLVLNKTNLRTLQGAFGDDIANWIGKIIVVFPTTTNLGGKTTPCLRVRIPPPKQATAAPQQPTAVPQQPVTSGNGAAALPAAAPVTAAASLAAAGLATAALAVVDPELEPDPVKPIGEDLDDEVAF